MLTYSILPCVVIYKYNLLKVSKIQVRLTKYAKISCTQISQMYENFLQ